MSSSASWPRSVGRQARGPVSGDNRDHRPAADNEFHRVQLNLGRATMAMTLAAAGLGVGSCHAGVAGIQLARELLGFPRTTAGHC